MTLTPHRTPDAIDLVEVAADLYRDIHKGIRSELFAVTLEAGQIDSGDLTDRIALDVHVGQVIAMLTSHAEHEDLGIQPSLEHHLPDLAATIEGDHLALEHRMARLADLSNAVTVAEDARARHRVHQLYVELASFTSAYLVHQDLEERLVMPALEQALGADAVLSIHAQIIGSIPPAELMQTLAVMFPAMNIDDRVELLGGMQITAPPEAFQAVVGLVHSVLDPSDAVAVDARLDLHR